MFVLSTDLSSEAFDASLLENDRAISALSVTRDEARELLFLAQVVKQAHLSLENVELLAVGRPALARPADWQTALIASLSQRFELRVEEVSIFEAMVAEARSLGMVDRNTVEVAALDPDGDGFCACVFRSGGRPELLRLSCNDLPAWLGALNKRPLVFRSIRNAALPARSVDLSKTRLSGAIGRIAWERNRKAPRAAVESAQWV